MDASAASCDAPAAAASGAVDSSFALEGLKEELPPSAAPAPAADLEGLKEELQVERERICQCKNALRQSELDAWKYKASFALEEERTRIITQSAVEAFLACVVTTEAAEDEGVRKGELEAQLRIAACERKYGELLECLESWKKFSQYYEEEARAARHDAQELRSSLSRAISDRNEEVETATNAMKGLELAEECGKSMARVAEVQVEEASRCKHLVRELEEEVESHRRRSAGMLSYN